MARRETSVTFSVRCEDSYKEAWERIAREKGMSRNAWIVKKLGDPDRIAREIKKLSS